MKFGIRTLLVITAFIAVVVFAFNYVATRPPGYKLKLERFHNELSDTATPNEIQQWAVASIAAYNGTSELEIPDLFDLPEFGRPSYLDVIDRNISHPYVYAHWGGGFGHWGIMVGDDQLPFPRGKDYDYIEWAPGVFVWHELQ